MRFTPVEVNDVCSFDREDFCERYEAVNATLEEIIATLERHGTEEEVTSEFYRVAEAYSNFLKTGILGAFYSQDEDFNWDKAQQVLREIPKDVLAGLPTQAQVSLLNSSRFWFSDEARMASQRLREAMVQFSAEVESLNEDIDHHLGL